jgi:hypothetical protein
MSQKKKFIITNDKEIANKLIFAGFQLISQNNEYVFLNQPSLNFNFNEIDKTKMAYTNILNI